MIPPHLAQQITANMEATRTAALLAQMFSRINDSETATKEREDDKLSKARYWWHERDK